MSRKYVIAGNWKMNKTPSEAKVLVKEVIEAIGAKPENVDVIVCPPFVAVDAAMGAAEGSFVKVGAQNLHFEAKGAYTGEIAADMLNDLGVSYVIIGHSERRQYFAETDETVNKKVLTAFEAGLTPIICVGETLEQREQGITADLIRMQVKIAFGGVTADQAKKAIIAYEPVWAIGTGKTATNEQADEVCGIIRETIGELYDGATAEEIIIQYGGSMNAGNAEALLAMPNIDGGLIGGAALKPNDFATIVKSAK
ncbi:MAG: triose-phosphate isomerase [Ruminococcaceae bacterium]|nr:triose-phosphate isomerase [Oscillospiraceae bacterium]